MFKGVYIPNSVEKHESGLAHIITIVLADGNIVDISPRGVVQIYTPDSKHGVEITLPSPLVDGGTVGIYKIG